MKTNCEHLFLAEEGDMSWLIFGLKVVPIKIQMLSVINSIFAYEPWNFSVTHLQNLLSKNEHSEWANLTELINAILVLLHFQKLSLIVENIGLKLSNSNKQIGVSRKKSEEEIISKLNNLKKMLKNKEFEHSSNNEIPKEPYEEKWEIVSGKLFQKHDGKSII